MNILLTSVGRRAYMVRYFQDALNGTGEVHVCNSDDMTVAFHYADKSVVSPLIYSPDYIPFLLDYCKDNRIDILLSLFDIDLLMLSKHKKEFSDIGTKVIVSDVDFVSVCNDKWKTYLFLKENGLPAPKTFLTLQNVLECLQSGDLSYPIIVKPRFGCGSIALSIAKNEHELRFYSEQVRDAVMRSYLKYESSVETETVIFQEFLNGQEYGVDVINDLNGNYVNAIVKKKIAMRAGETDIAETVCAPAIVETAKSISFNSKHIGNLDVDVFLVGDTPFVLEMNARFGGGYPFSHVAGCNLPLAIVKWCKGENVERNLLEGRLNVRAFKELVLTKSSGQAVRKLKNQK